MSIYTYTYACCVMVIVIDDGHDKLSSNLDKAVCNSYNANTLGNGMNPTIFPPTIGK